MRWAVALVLVVLVSGCASFYFVRPVVIEEYVGAKVRVYRNGSSCRIEVTTLTESIQTLPTHCWATPIVPRGTP